MKNLGVLSSMYSSLGLNEQIQTFSPTKINVKQPLRGMDSHQKTKFGVNPV